MDGFNPPSWPPDNQNLTTPGAETADYEFGRPMELDNYQQQSAPSYYLPNQLPMSLTAEEYNQLQTGNTAPSNFQVDQSQFLTTPWSNHPPHLSDAFDFGHDHTGMQGGYKEYTGDSFFNGYTSPTFASPTSLRANPPLSTGSPQLAFNNQGGSSFYLDTRMAPSQPAVFNPSLNANLNQLTFNNQEGNSYYPNTRMAPSQPANFNPPLNADSNQLAFTNQGRNSYHPDSRIVPSQPTNFNPLFNTFPTQLTLNNQARSSSYLDPTMARSQSAIFSPPLQIPSTINGQLGTMGNTAPLNPPFDQYGFPTVSSPDYLPHDSGVFGFGSEQADVQDDPGSNGNVGVYFGDDFNFATHSMLNVCEPCVSDQRFYQSGNTGSFEDNHHSNQIATKQAGERVEGLPAYQNEFFGIGSHANALLTQGSDEDSQSRDLLDKYGTFKFFSTLPLKLQKMIWKALFPAGRAAFIDYAIYPHQIKLDERRTGLPITLAICKISRQVTMEHYTIVDRHHHGSRAIYMKPFCFNPEVDTLCITYNFIKPYGSKKVHKVWYDEVDKALKKKGALKDVGLKGVRFLDVRDVVTSLPVDTSNISWFLPRVYRNSFLSRFKNLDRLVFTGACAIDDWLSMPRLVTLDSLGECELFWEELAKYLENQKKSHKGRLIAKEKIIVREYEAPQGISALERLQTMDWLF
ncbi:uncharacterized protein Bfra_007845 [Botrytis fragariae]|uniref:2EXR domain-containing protein n=1 Tax=Botrytis fragariae TaxID=1964551 RepID=A0A8H6APM5_9HELO|nr:uncharacterized protein Bfra_007845 [Botrytis fragariae]KAF5871329.1 hypothetical protein Bfra_007845 [Botrytis fragariae]